MAQLQTDSEFNPLNKLISLFVLLGAALYFTGWTYRWMYFGFFQLEVTTLNLPIESFYFAALQTLCGEPAAVLKTTSALLLNLFVILFIAQIRPGIGTYTEKLPLISSSKTHIRQILGDLLNELIIVILIMTSLFWLARGQAEADAWKDAVNETSSLPLITVVLPERKAALGRNPDNPLENPTGFRVIGDQALYDNLLGQELTDNSDLNKKRIWRLLIDREGYFYIFPALPSKDKNLTIPVVTIYQSVNGDQLTILSASPAKP